MSAYVVETEHIDALVQLALSGPADRAPRYPGDGWGSFRWYRIDSETGDLERHQLDFGSRDETGAMLLRECIASVAYRYQDTLWPELPGPVPNPDPGHYECDFTSRSRRPTTIEGLKLLDCYEYQSCEHPGWRDSSAKAFCETLRNRLIKCLPGYDDAAWEWPPPSSPAASFD